MSTYLLQVVSVVAIINCGKKYLLVQRKKEDNIFPGKWQNLGGKVELGERIEEALRREIKEEINLKISSKPEFVASYSWKKNKNSPVRLGIVFYLKLTGDITDHKVALNDESEKYKWLTFKQVEKMEDNDLLIGKGHPTGTFGQIKLSLTNIRN